MILLTFLFMLHVFVYIRPLCSCLNLHMWDMLKWSGVSSTTYIWAIRDIFPVSDDIFKCIFLNENVRIPIKIPLKFVPKGPINNIPALVQIMAWRRPGDKPLSEPMMLSLPTHICVTRPQWVTYTTKNKARGFLISTHWPMDEMVKI